MEKVCVILPTYNEAENISQLISLIGGLHPPWSILVIDDSSPDGTAEIVEGLKNTKKNLYLVKREGERGRGKAGAYGFDLAIKKGSDIIIEMDADMSHHPQYLEALVREIEHYDVVIGSRYVETGGEIGRALSRRLISRLANFYLRLMLGFSIHDWTSGYRCFRREALAAIVSGIKSKGPSIVEEVLFKIKKRGFAIKEIPIIFYEREKGKSKLNLRILLKTLFYPFQLRLLH